METETNIYQYEILQQDQTDLIEQAAVVLGRTFVGVEVAGKWIQEPMIGFLNLPYEDWYQFCKDYLVSVVHQGFCAVALDDARQVVGVLAADSNRFEIYGEPIFEGSFKDMNIVLEVLEDIDLRFLEDYRHRYGKELEDGEVLHLFLLGVMAPTHRHEAVKGLSDLLMAKAREAGLRMMIAEATNPKSMSLLERYQGLTKHVDQDGNYIVHKYATNEKLNMIPASIADGTYIITREL